MLSSTLHSYFKGEKDLFAGLQIETLETEWRHYPVLHFDFSTAKNHSGIEEIRKELLRQIALFEEQYQMNGDVGQTPGQRLETLVRHIFRLTGEQVVVIIDEYDGPMLDALPLLYQSGYLTIKGYDTRWDTYHLALPNKEVRVGLMENLLPLYTKLSDYENQGFIRQFCQALDAEDMNAALTALRAYMAGIPYTDGMKSVLNDVAKAEGFYEYLFYVLFSCMNQYVRTQVRTNTGRIDMVFYFRHSICVFELKINRPAKDALHQIDEKNYLLPYTSDGRKLVKCGISFNTTTRNVEEWKLG